VSGARDISWPRRWWRRLRGLWRSEAIHREIAEEMQFHIDMRAADNVRAGMPAEEARREAEARFGHRRQIHAQGYEVRGGGWLETLWRDLAFAARILVKNRGFTAVAVVTLALGIGANTAIFSVVDAILLRPLPFRDPERLVLVKQNLPRLGLGDLAVSPAEYFDYASRGAPDPFSRIAAFTEINLNLTGDGDPQRIQAARVSAGLFPLLGVAPLHGRAFSPGEDAAGRDQVVVLGHSIWQRHFGSDPGIVGRTIRLDDRPYTVIGVMPPRFRFPGARATFARRAELWVPLVATEEERANRARSFDYGVVARLQTGTSLPQARARIRAVAAEMHERHRDIYDGDGQIAVDVVGMEADAVKDVRPLLVFLLCAVGMVLLVACANVASLLLARAIARHKEMAIRSAVGAGRRRLIRQLLTESLLLSLLGGAVGLLLAVGSVHLFARLGPEQMPQLQDVGVEPRVLAFTAIVSLLTGVLFGLAPALNGSGVELDQVLRDAGGRSSRGRQARRLRSTLIVVETAAALVLLVGAGLLINSFARVLRVPPGFDPHGVLIAQTALSATRYPTAERSKAVQRQVLDRLAAIPGVEVAGETTNLPLVGDRSIAFAIEGDSGGAYTAYNAWVSEDYFRAMGIPLLEGRAFGAADRPGAPPAIIINQTMARRFWPGGGAIGRRIKWGGWGDEWLTVVGIAADVKVSSFEAETNPAVYMPLFQIPRARSDVMYVVRTSGDPTRIVAAVRRELRAVDPSLPVFNIRTMNQVMAESVAQRRFSTLLLTVFAAVALLLAALGLYSVMSCTVAQRTHEIGIRVALGAQSGDVMKLVLGQGMMLTLAGVAIGLVAALAVTRLMERLLYGVSASDPLTFAAVSVLLVAVAMLACWLPTRRATRVNPLIALRHD
jgi:putative ABC transport system permease protein